MCEHLAVYLSSVSADQSVHVIKPPLRYLMCFSLELQHYSKIHFTAIAAPVWRTRTGREIIALVFCAAGEPMLALR